MSDSADEDLRDVFKLLYDTDDWAMEDDEEPVQPSPEAHIVEPEVEQVELDLEDPTERLQERYSRKRFLDDFNDLLSPSAKRQRIYTPPSSPSTTTSIPCSAPFPSLPPSSTYAPFSPLPLLSRLRTFEPSSYSPYMPSPLDAAQAALHGWVNDGRDSLSCGVCEAKWDLSGVTDIREEKVRVEVAKRLGPGLANKHKKDCSWRVRYSPDTLPGQLRRLLHPNITFNLSLLALALEDQCISRARSDVSWSSPLVENLQHRISPHNSAPVPASHPISTFAAALALFCWYPFHPNGPSHTISDSSSRRTDIVQCRLCERRVGLWAFRSASDKEGARAFDLVEEHLGWCPVRDSAVERKWWDDLPLLQPREKSGVGEKKSWISISGKMEVRPWRRVKGPSSS